MLVVGAAVAAGTSCLALTSRGEKDMRPALGRTLRLTCVRLVRAARELSRVPAVERVLTWDPVRRPSCALAATPLAVAVGADAEVAGVALLVGFCAEAVLAAILFASPLAGAVAGAATVAVAVARDAVLRQRRGREVSSSMPEIYRTLSVALGSGQTLAQAVAYVGSHERGPAAEVFARMSLRLRCGMGTEEAVGLLAEELGAPGTDLLAAALVISHRTGSPLRELLMRSAGLAERQGEFQRLLAVKTAQVRLSVRIVCLLPVVMIGVLAVISPDFQQGLLTPVGMGCVALAAVLDGVALVIIRGLVRGVM